MRWLMLVSLLVGCEKADEANESDGASETEVLASCEAYCDATKDSPGCDGDAVQGLCYGLCANEAAPSAGCADDAVAYYTCVIDAPHVCDGSMNWDGIDYPHPEDLLVCNAEYNRLCF